MATRLSVFALMVTVLTAPALAVSIVDEDFDSYASQAAFEAVWNPDQGDGNFDLTGFVTAGELVPAPGSTVRTFEAPNDNPPGIQGNGVNVLDLINEYNGSSFSLVPTASESIRYGGDIFDAANDISSDGKRVSIGLRNDTVEREFGVFGTNFVEMGIYNADGLDPTDGVTVVPATGYAFRVVLFGTPQAPLIQNPNWLYFPLDIALDTGNDDPGEEQVDRSDIGPGWHSYTATISETQITLTLDLFRDGVTNLTRDINGDIEVGVGAPGVDSTVTFDISPFDSDPGSGDPFDPFTSLRIGGPSGITGNDESVVDNVFLETVSASTPGDEDGDGDVDVADALAIQRNGGTFGDWEANFGTGSAVAAVAAVPEPTSIGLLLLAGIGAVSVRRR